MTPITGSQFVHWWTDTAREWSWRHTGLGLLVGALALFNMGGALFFPPDFAFTRNLVYNVFEFGLPFVFMLRVADRAVADGVPRGLAYGVGTVAMIVTGVWVIGPLLLPFIGGDPRWTAADDVSLAQSLSLPFAVGTVAYAAWRRAHDTLRRVQAAEVERARQEQALQAARLLALQARVEPQFLFDALARVRQNIERSTEAAEELLGDLIALLRAMQPASGATASTVAREFDLVRAYARASEAPALQPPRLVLDAEDDVLEARLAPLVLLPALRSLVGDAPAAGWQVGAARIGDRLRLAVTPSVVDATTTTAFQVLDVGTLVERLNAVHGSDARLLVSAGEPSALQIDAPFEVNRHDDDPSADR